jgi:diacylglycerol kinase family enzyme
LHLAPDATLDDPLTMVTIRSLRLGRLMALATSALFGNGARLQRSRHVDYRPRVHGVLVTGERPFPYQVDGDHLGSTRRLEFRYEPDALRLVVPERPETR